MDLSGPFRVFVSEVFIFNDFFSSLFNKKIKTYHCNGRGTQHFFRRENSKICDVGRNVNHSDYGQGNPYCAWKIPELHMSPLSVIERFHCSCFSYSEPNQTDWKDALIVWTTRLHAPNVFKQWRSVQIRFSLVLFHFKVKEKILNC